MVRGLTAAARPRRARHHASAAPDAEGRDVIAFHAWDTARTGRYMHLRRLEVDPSGPMLRVDLDGPLGSD